MHRFTRSIFLDNLNDLEVQGHFTGTDYGVVTLDTVTIGQATVTIESLTQMNGKDATERALNAVRDWWRDEGLYDWQRAERDYAEQARIDARGEPVE